MDETRFTRELHASLARRPFEPFDVQLPGGGRLTVDDPQALAVRGGVAIYIHPDGKLTLLDSQRAHELTIIASRPRPRETLRPVVAALLVVYLLGICGSVIAAAIKIESIVGTGPAFSAVGLFVAECGRRCRSRAMFWLGISTLALSLFVLVLINVAEWGPDAAHVPVSVVLLIYESVAIPAGLWALWRLWVSAPGDPRTAWQFDLRSLLLVICLVAVALTAGRVANHQNLGALAAVAIGFCAATLCTMGMLGVMAQRQGYLTAVARVQSR